MSRTVSFYLMRHPKHVDDMVTQEGEEQISAAAKKLFAPLGRFYRIFATEKGRAWMTAKVALGAIGQHIDMPDEEGRIEVDRSFGFQYVEDEMDHSYPFAPAVQEIERRRASGQFVSVHDMITELWPPAMVVRHVLRTTMRHWAERLCWVGGGDINVLVGNHASNVYATMAPEETDGYPPHCSVAVYHWKVSDRGASLEASDLLLP